MGRNEEIEPHVVAIKQDGSIRLELDGTLTPLDDPHAAGDLPGLDAKLRDYAERVRGGNAAPVVRVMMDDAAPYQRFIDVLSRLHDHGLELSASALFYWFQTDIE